MPDPETSRPFYEPFIASHFPGWHERREASRIRSASLSSYRGGIATRTSTPWAGSQQSLRGGTAVQRLSLATMRDRSRTIYRDNPIGRSLVDTETSNVVAQGFTLQGKTSNEDFNREVEEEFPIWLDRADMRDQFTGAQFQQLAWRRSRIDGDAGIVLVDRGGESRLQFIPGDLIKNPDGQMNNPNLFDGVEVDAFTRPRAFHVGDFDEWGKRSWTRVPASNFIYLPHLDEPLQVRGMPCYAQIFTLLDQIDGYVDAVVIAARMAAIFGLIFKEDNGAKQTQGLPFMQNGAGQMQRALTLENGLVKWVGKEGQIVQVQAQQPMSQTPDFIRAIFRLICLAFDMPLEIGMKDLSQVNFSGGRIGLISYYRSCRAKQDIFKVRLMTRIYQWWVSRQVKLGRFTSAVPEDYWNHTFMGREWDYTDPVTEAEADDLEIKMGIKSPQMAAAARGRDWDNIQLQNARANEVRKSLGLVPASQPDSAPSDGATVGDGASGTSDAAAVSHIDSFKVEAGAITPQIEDETHFREKAGLPPMSQAARDAWQKDLGTRRPITLTMPGETEAAPPNPAPTNTEEDQDDA